MPDAIESELRLFGNPPRLSANADWYYNGKIPVLRRANKTTYLFPDTPQVIAHIARLKDPQAEEADSTRPVRP